MVGVGKVAAPTTMKGFKMNDLDKLQSPLNRAIREPIDAVIEFWADVPEDYMALATNRNSAEAKLYLNKVRKAGAAMVKGANVLAAIVRDLDGPTSASRVIIDSNGVPSIDETGAEWSLVDEVVQHVAEERARWQQIEEE